MDLTQFHQPGNLPVAAAAPRLNYENWRVSMQSDHPIAKRGLPKSVVIALILGIFLTGFMAIQVCRLETDKLNSQFSRRADFRIRVFEQSVVHAVDQLHNLNQLFKASRTPVGPEQFREVAQSLLAQQSYIHSLVFHRFVTASQRGGYEAAMRAGQPGFAIRRVQDGQLFASTGPGPWLAVEYYEPLEGNEAVLGYDAFSAPQHRLATMRAIDTGKASASDLTRAVVQPHQRNVDGMVFAVVMPLYLRGALLDTVAARRQAFMGETMAGFHAASFAHLIFEGAGLLNTPDTHINVYAAATATEDALVLRYGAPPPSASEVTPILSLMGHPALVSVGQTVDLAGKPWRVIISRDLPDSLEAYPGALLVLAAGLALTLLTAAYLSAVATRTRLVEQTITRRTMQLQATSSELLLRNSAIEASANAIFITSAEGPDYRVEYVNPAFTRITGYASDEIVGQPVHLLSGVDREQPGLATLGEALDARKDVHTVVRSYRKDGTMYWNDIHVSPVHGEGGVVRHFVHVNYDVTATRRYQEQLEHRANFDFLTGLANSTLLQDRIQQAISYAARLHRKVWIAYIDVDRFKFINDSAGHSFGDTLLKTVAGRIAASVQAADTAGRMGGDEFVLVLPQYEDSALSVSVLKQVLARVSAPIVIGDKEFFVTCSIGIAAFPEDGTNSEALLMHADRAMYRAKEIGGNNVQFFESALNKRTARQLLIEGELRHALPDGQFVLHYQPQVDLRSGAIVGAEALLRWQHPQLGLIMPGEFISLAEETGLIVPIGDWVLRIACAQNCAWQAATGVRLRIAVNLSGIQFARDDIVSSIGALLDDSGLDPACLEIELTESIVMQDVERTVTTLLHLKALGVQLSLDDFGTGYSSLAYLKRFPIDVIKIDKSFVRDIVTNHDDATIVVSIINLAHKLRMKVIAEGVETPKQLAFLRANGCDEIQGYYFSEPVTSGAIGQMLREGKRLELVMPTHV